MDSTFKTKNVNNIHPYTNQTTKYFFPINYTPTHQSIATIKHPPLTPLFNLTTPMHLALSQPPPLFFSFRISPRRLYTSLARLRAGAQLRAVRICIRGGADYSGAGAAQFADRLIPMALARARK